jgi:hypothetical protein
MLPACTSTIARNKYLVDQACCSYMQKMINTVYFCCSKLASSFQFVPIGAVSLTPLYLLFNDTQLTELRLFYQKTLVRFSVWAIISLFTTAFRPSLLSSGHRSLFPGVKGAVA